VQVRAPNVEAAARVRVEEPGASEVRGEPDDRDGEHRPPEHVRGRPQASVGLHENRAGDGEQHERVDERRQNLGTVVAVGLGGRRRAGRDPDGEEREGERAHVGEHVARVREEREASREERTQHLDDKERGREPERREEPTA